MGLEEKVAKTCNTKDNASQTWTLCTHAFYDLTHVSPVVFMVLLKEYYYYGTCKATAKFRALQNQIHLVLHNDPKPGPATFIVHCMYVSPLFEDHSQGFTHMIVSALRRFLKRTTTIENSLEVKDLVAHLLVDVMRGQIYHDEKIVMKLVEIFDVKLTNIEKAMCQVKEKHDLSCGLAKELVEEYIVTLVKSQLYMTAVTLMEQFSIYHYGQSFLLDMIQSNQFKAAEKWATFMGKPMLSILVNEFNERNMLKNASEIIKKNNLKQEFPDVYKRSKESSLKNLAEKGCWDVAEAKINNDMHLMEYLVYLAMEAGYTEKVDELCHRYSLERFLDTRGYNFQCDVRQLSHAYGELRCFKNYEMLLDIQNIFKELRGGLAGLTEKILGASLNKTRRNSNWEQRPLTPNQLEYAALDAVVLVHIFRHLPGHGHDKPEWKSFIVSRNENGKKSKKHTPKVVDTEIDTSKPSF
ncbi:uncharacterized protein LOC108324334 isoform X3 [Vigna angularis]|uniref:uncharacterized protein LOC108324334 isoform X3 n=1 Tax=Phaseolus angularis TaxID=3914 RepID=UPI0022B3F89D|nr:uncharacterized protein LOC108324334 isoform X3 [Vigna angularis]